MFKLTLANKGKLAGKTEFVLLDKDGNVKKLFQWNLVGIWFKKLFDLDIVSPFTGKYVSKMVLPNKIVNGGAKRFADLVGGTNTPVAMTALAIGTGTTAAAGTDTALQTEITTNGGGRGAATISNTTTSITGDTEQFQKTWTFTGSFAVTEEGILDNNTSGGTLLAHNVFSAVNVSSGDSLQVTHKVQVSPA